MTQDVPLNELNDEDELLRLEWDFQPYTNVFAGNLTEPVYVGNWQKMMLTGTFEEKRGVQVRVDPFFIENYPHEFPFLDVLPYYSKPDKHDARLASTFIHALSRGGMNHIRHEMEKAMSLSHSDRQTKYFSIWADANIRSDCVNAIPRDFITQSFSHVAKRATSVHDIETLEEVVMWLAKDKGQDFLRTCLLDIAKTYTHE